MRIFTLLALLLSLAFPGAVQPAHPLSYLHHPAALAVSAGENHTCTVTSDGKVLCWGGGAFGQLGDGTFLDHPLPAEVSGVSGASALASGQAHTCTLVGDGLKCWGRNNTGQLGNNSTTNSATPVTPAGMGANVAAVSAGGGHTCVKLASNGELKCWGLNTSGELGDNSTTNRFSAVSVYGPLNVLAVAAGESHTCAILPGGEVKCWGLNTSGQLGDNTITNSSIPVPTSGLTSGVIALAAGGAHTCALTDAGSVLCWGLNTSGQLGSGSNAYRKVPTPVTGLPHPVTRITAGHDFTCAVDDHNGLYCWGAGVLGQLGNGSAIDSTVPVAVINGGLAVSALAAGRNHACVVVGGGTLRCWGDNSSGQLGDGTAGRSLTPASVIGLTDPVAQLASGDNHTCVVTESGAALCWGRNDYGQLGDGTYTTRTLPTPVYGLSSGVKALAAGSGHTCALTTAGGVLCWGDNYHGELGKGGVATYPEVYPVQVVGLASGVKAITAGARHTCALMNTGDVKCWGDNSLGQVGVADISHPYKRTPQNVTLLAPHTATSLSAGAEHTCAVVSMGMINCWGYNFDGELGDHTNATRYVPTYPVRDVDDAAITGFVHVFAGGKNTCATKSNGDLPVDFLCWGDNGYGQLSDGTTTDSSVPLLLAEMSGVSLASAGHIGHICAVMDGGGLKCWGDNENGQIGDGATIDRHTPVDVLAGMASVAAGSAHTCAVDENGAVLCWGDNHFGQLGNGISTYRASPVNVVGLGGGDIFLFLPAVFR